MEWCRPRGEGEGWVEGCGSAEVRYFQRLEKATPANHRAPTSVCITLTKTTCLALNIEARKENRPRVVVSIRTAPPQPARRDFAIAIWSQENRTVSCFGILNAVQKRHASETTEAVLRMEYGCWRYVAERRSELGLMAEMEPQGWRMGSRMVWRPTEERSMMRQKPRSCPAKSM